MNGKAISKSAFVLAFVLAVLYVLGTCAKEEIIYKTDVYSNGIAKVFIILVLIILTGVFGIIFSMVFNALDIYHSKKKATSYECNILDTIDKKDLLKLILLFFVCWTPYIIIRFPGNIDHDTMTQLVQAYGYTTLTDHHPLFDTLFFYLFWRIGDILGSNGISLFLYTIFQFLTTAFAGALTILYFEKLGIGKRIKKFCILFFCFFPIIPLFAQVMDKDSLFAWIFLLYCIYFFELVRSRGTLLDSKKNIALFMLILLFMMLTKKTGVYIIVVAAVMVLFYLKKNRIRAVITFAIPIFIFMVLWSKIVMAEFNIEQGQQQEMLSVPSEQVGCIVRDCYDELSEEDWEILNSVYWDASGMRENYNPILADLMKVRWKNDSSSADKSRFFKWYLQQYFKHPREMFLSVFALDYSIVCVDVETNDSQSMLYFWDNITTKDKPSEKLEIMAPYTGATTEQVHKILYTTYRNEKIGKLSRAFEILYLNICKSFAVLFSKVLYATWIPLFAFFYAIHRKDFISLFGMINVVLTTGILFIGPTVLPRYMVTSVYITLINIGVIFRYFQKNEETQ